MNNRLVWCFLLHVQLIASFEFQNYDVVREMTTEIAHKYHCGCIVVLLPASASESERRFLEKLSFSLAAGYNSKEKLAPKQVSVFTKDRYAEAFLSTAKLQAGSCFKWLNLVMVAETTLVQLQQLSESHMFNKPLWLIFSNGSFLHNLKGVELYLNSQVWVVQPEANDVYSVSEIYRVKSGFEERINYLGEWSEVGGLRMASVAKMLRRRNLEGLNLRAGLSEDWGDLRRGNNKFVAAMPKQSFFLSIFHNIEQLLNFTAKPRLYNKDGPGVQDVNGSWTGLLGMVQTGKIDIIISELDYTAKRVQIIDPLLPLIKTGTQIYFPLNGYQFDWKAVLRPFHFHVWFALLTWVFIGSVMLNIVERIAAKFGLETPPSVTLTDGVLFLLRTLCLQGCNSIPKIWALRILFISCYLVATVILPSYSAALVSSLSMRTPNKPFENLDELAESNFKLIFMPHSSIAEYMMEEKNPNVKKIMKSLWVNDTKIAGSLVTALDYMCAHSRVAVLTANGLDLTMYRRSNGEEMCRTTDLGTTIYKIDQSLALAKYSPYYKTINYYLLKMLETGNIRRYKEIFLPSWRKNTQKFDIALRLQNVSEIFLILFLGYLLSILIFSYEIVKKRYAIT